MRSVYNAHRSTLVLPLPTVFFFPYPRLLPTFAYRRLPTAGMRHGGEDIPVRNKFTPSGYAQSRKSVPTALACGYALSPDSQVTRGRRAPRRRRSDYKPVLLQCGIISQDEFDGLMGMELLKFGEARRKVSKTREVNAGGHGCWRYNQGVERGIERECGKRAAAINLARDMGVTSPGFGFLKGRSWTSSWAGKRVSWVVEHAPVRFTPGTVRN